MKKVRIILITSSVLVLTVLVSAWYKASSINQTNIRIQSNISTGCTFYDICEEWQLPTKTFGSIYIWKTHESVLVGAFENINNSMTLNDYVLYNKSGGVVSGTVPSNLTSDIIINRVANDKEDGFNIYDIGSGGTINATLSYDGWIICWYDKDSIWVHDCFTLKELNMKLFKIFHGLLFDMFHRI